VLVGGSFYSYNGITREYIARLNTDGSLDNNFAVGTGFASSNSYLYVKTIFLQPDGKILAGGAFNSYNGSAQNCIVRLNPSGSIDNSFNTGTGFGSGAFVNWVNTLSMQPDGKILAGGNFTAYNGISRRGVVRIATNGAVDSTFVVSEGFDFLPVEALAVQQDGKVIAGGGFLKYNQVNRSAIARLHGNSGSPVSVTSEKQTPFVVYPNPSTGLFKLQTDIEDSYTSYQVINVLGKVISSGKIIDKTATMDLSMQPEGIYWLKLISGLSSQARQIVIAR
jgi:uncharacterized delta-60 repeat protein